MDKPTAVDRWHGHERARTARRRAYGTTLTHEHIFLDIWKEYGREGVLNDVDLAVRELDDYVDAGGATVIDCTSIEIGRDPQGLVKVSERTGLNIVMGTSHYRHPYLDREWFDRLEHRLDRAGSH